MGKGTASHSADCSRISLISNQGDLCTVHCLSVWSVHYSRLWARLVPRCKSSLRLSEISVSERAMRGQPLQVTRAVICSVIGKPIQSANLQPASAVRASALTALVS